SIPFKGKSIPAWFSSAAWLQRRQGPGHHRHSRNGLEPGCHTIFEEASPTFKKRASIVSFFRHAAQGLEERKQILYLLGPVGGGKSSLAERRKSLMEVHPIYVLKAGDELSPVFKSPLGLFDPETMGPIIEERYGIPRRRLNGLMSPWCLKRLEAFGGDISRFPVANIQRSR